MAAGGTRAVADGIYAGPGFVPFGLQAVVKFGGSIMRDVGLAARTGAELAALAREAPLLVFPGGGPSDKLVEELARQARLETDIVNPANMRALDQTGILLAAMTRGAEAVADLAAARAVIARGGLPVLLPSALVLALDVFTRKDVITSDTIGAYFAFLVGAPLYVVLTDVDGVYRGRGDGDPGTLVREISAGELAGLGATSVDRCFGSLLEACGLRAWVLNGAHPARVREVLRGGRPPGTEILP